MNTTDSPTTTERSRVVPMQLKHRRYFSIVWLVPLVAAAVAGYLIYQRTAAAGPLITIHFQNGDGLKAGQSPVKFRGVTVGEVQGMTLSPDLQHVVVKARLAKSAAHLARQGAVFWIVRPEVGMRSITGLGTIISGPYIEVLPGAGAAAKVFEGAVVAPMKQEDGALRIVLLSSSTRSVRPGSPVYYRGIEVGVVQEQRLSNDGRDVESEVSFPKRYARLVRAGSRFWNASGVDVDFSLFKGAKVNVESMKSLVSGGVAFATPENTGELGPVQPGTTFRLYDEPKKEWLDWAPLLPEATDERPRR
jgi:paraquat-inducible protein B